MLLLLVVLWTIVYIYFQEITFKIRGIFILYVKTFIQVPTRVPTQVSNTLKPAPNTTVSWHPGGPPPSHCPSPPSSGPPPLSSRPVATGSVAHPRHSLHRPRGACREWGAGRGTPTSLRRLLTAPVRWAEGGRGKVWERGRRGRTEGGGTFRNSVHKVKQGLLFWQSPICPILLLVRRLGNLQGLSVLVLFLHNTFYIILWLNPTGSGNCSFSSVLPNAWLAQFK